MTHPNTEVDLAELHQAILADIRAAFPQFKTVAFYREETDRKPFPPADLPACLLELDVLEPQPDEDPQTEQLPVLAQFEARLVVGFRTPDAKMAIRLLAAQFATWLRRRRWNHPRAITPKLPTGAAQVTACMADHFSPSLDQFEVWRVEWSQFLTLGATVWTNEGTIPTELWLGWAPAVGAEHEADYVKAQQ